jgi:hypothetical protein
VSSVDEISGLVGGEDIAVLGLSTEDSSSDLEVRVGEDFVWGYKSGALYASMFVVWVNSMGLEILLRIEPDCPKPLAVELLRFGRTPMSVDDCFTRRVVKARANDIFADSLLRYTRIDPQYLNLKATSAIYNLQIAT